MFKSLPAVVRPFALRCCLYTFIAQLPPIIIIYVFYMTDLGFRPAQIGFLVGFWYIVAMVMEIPSSIVADRFSRRRVLMIGEFSSALGFLAMWIWPTPFGFCIGLFLWALRGAFYSGTYDAYVYDELQLLEDTSSYTRLVGLKTTTLWVGLFCATTLATLYHTYGITIVAIISATARIAAGIIIGTGPEAAKQKLLGKTSMRTMCLDAWQVLKSDRQLVLLFALSIAIGQMGLLFEYRPVVFNGMGFSPSMITILILMTYATVIIGSAFGHRLPLERFSTLVATAAVPVGLTLGFALVPYPIPAILALLVGLLLQQAWLIHSDMHKQNRIPSHVRATVGSFAGFWDSGTSVLISNAIGLSAMTVHYQQAMAIVVIPALCLLLGYGIIRVIQRMRPFHVR